ncbi:Bromodomain-containing protein [Mollisia scopiformis]|uniref:Bromodomain-containing protein n=1 Tax=Mollisia scopiformis TaxID=149040 RepID=A0A194X3U9_MOLSC|nr:Bromodomain-containing protein [Mollisia scopiformis]KUJ14719.1 Bromodomain-containing protein [Mollisia scopiformis]
MASRSPEPSAADSEMKQEVKQEDAAATENNATTGSSPPATTSAGEGLSKKDFELMTNILARISNYRDKDGHDIAKDFQRIVSRRALPDYFDVIKEPIALSTLRQKIGKKQYSSYKDWIRDLFLIPFNAQTYNRRSAPVYGDSIILADLFRAELKKLVDDQVISAEEAQEPDLGPIPEQEDSPPPNPEDEELEEDDEEEDEDEEDDDTDDDRPRRRKKGRRSSTTAKREGKTDDGGKDDPESQKKRGRPPKVHTPMEARINTLLKGLRKFKHPKGDLKILPFEKLPDKSVMPEYYQEIKNPIAMDLIKRKAKRKKYHSVDQALKDLELMFENAKVYNLETSQVYKDAVELQKEARILAEQEKKKPDSDFVDEDGRLPLPEILYKGEIWKVGDWIHLTNHNDMTKPIVAQIYRTWQDPEGQKWINACWYYRPEQTVHRYEKHFFENEVVKTGQYRDHKIEEVVDRCFVMFFTRYNKGRPRGFPADKEVYVCEARYNEEKFKLNKIKTWASCVPDEVREKDYEMDLFDAPRKMRKVPSPIKHLLREDAKEDDPLPRPTWGVANAPPIVGAVHKRPREANESPPPEPTPSPPPPSPEPVRRPIMSEQRRYDSQNDVSMSGTTGHVTPSPSPMPSTVGQSAYGQQFAAPRPSPSPAPLNHQTSYGSHSSGSHAATPQTALYQSRDPYSQYTSATTPVAQTHSAALQSFAHAQYQSHTAPRPVAVTTGSHSSHTNAYNPPRPAEVWTLPENANNAIAPEIRAQFHTDEYGKIIFYTAPPLDVNPVPVETQTLGHSLRYLADKARNKEADAKKRKARELEMESEAIETSKRVKVEMESERQSMIKKNLNAVKTWSQTMDAGTDELYKQMNGEDWKEVRDLDQARLAVLQQQATTTEKENRKYQNERIAEKEMKISGKNL